MSKDLIRHPSGSLDPEKQEPAYIQRLRNKLQQRMGTVPEITDTDCLLLDLSHSMAWPLSGDEFNPQGPSKYDELKKLLRQFPKIRRFYFHTSCEELKDGEEPPLPTGGTAMHIAFRHLKARGIKHAVMLTDGMPDNEDYAIRDAMGLKIDIVYVGPDPQPDILCKLAKMTGGSYEGDIKFGSDGTKRLAAKVRGFLEAPKK